MKFEKILRTPFFTEHLRWLLLKMVPPLCQMVAAYSKEYSNVLINNKNILITLAKTNRLEGGEAPISIA